MDDVVKELDPKAVAFSRVATRHVRHTIASIRRLQGLGGVRYASSQEQREQILNALRSEFGALEMALFPVEEAEEPFRV